MWLMLQQPTLEDYVVATGESHQVREFAELGFSRVGLDYRDYVMSDPNLKRPSGVGSLMGDATQARYRLGWTCRSTFKAFVFEMVDSDCHAEGVDVAKVHLHEHGCKQTIQTAI